MADTVLNRYAELLDGGPGQPVWLAEQRRQAMQRVRSAGLPTRRLPAWHYSAVDQWLATAQERYGRDLTPADAELAKTSTEPPLPGAVFTFSHGVLVQQNPAATTLPAGVSCQPLAELDEQADADLISWLAARQDDPLAALADALAPDTRVLTIRADAALDQPLVMHYQASRPGVHALRLVVRIEAGARATLVEHFSGYQGCDYLSLARTAIQVGRDAQLTYVRVNRDGNQGQHVGLLDLDQAQGSRVMLQAVAANGGRVRNGLNINLIGTDARFTCGGVFAGSGKQHIDYHISVNHLANRGTSETRFQGLAGDEATGVVNGRLYIARDTRANDAQLTTHNLLLSSQAEIDAKPELEIYAEEVSCAHGATVGQLDPEQLQYLRSRGISRSDAIDLLTDGFLRRGLLPLDEALTAYLEQQVASARQRLDSQRINV